MISILGTIGEMERSQIQERQREGIDIARAKGVYSGRKKGTNKTQLNFFQNLRIRKQSSYWKKAIKTSNSL